MPGDRPARDSRELDREIADTFPASDAPSHSPVVGVGAPKHEAFRRRDELAIGFALSSEESHPKKLVRLARIAEESGLDFLSVSDHYHPWLSAQGNSPFVWSVLGGIATATSRINVMTGVTCPIMRIHPAIIAQAAATVADMMDGRFCLGLGTGEALNELVTGERWPSARERLARLREAIAIIRELFSGERIDFDGDYYTVSDARLFTRPQRPPAILVAAAAPASARLAAGQDGLIATNPNADLVREYESAGGAGKPRVGQVTLCWDESEDDARRIARKYWATTVLGWEVRSWVSTPEMFEDITKDVTEEEVAKNIPCGPDLSKALEQLRSFRDAGFDHVYIHQVGPKQEEFLAVLRDRLLPELRKEARRAA